MEALSFLIIVTAMAVFNAFLAYVLGWLFTEVVRYPLQFKPFNCRGCLAFWANLLLGVLLAFTLTPYFPAVECVTSVRQNLATGEITELANSPYYGPVRLSVTYGIIAVSVLTGLINFLYIKLKFRIYE